MPEVIYFYQQLDYSYNDNEKLIILRNHPYKSIEYYQFILIDN